MRPLPVVLGESTACVESIDRRKKTDARREERDGDETKMKTMKKKEKKKKREKKNLCTYNTTIITNIK